MSIDWQLLRELRRQQAARAKRAKDTKLDITILQQLETPQPEAKGKPSCMRKP